MEIVGFLVVGLLVGSFLNVVIIRLPKMLEKQWRSACEEFLHLENNPSKHNQAAPVFNLSLPASHCVHCLHKLRLIDNIPLLSFLLLRGRCFYCHAKISYQYPVVEFLTAITTAMVCLRFNLSPSAGCGMVFTWVVLVLAVIDHNKKLLPDNLTLPLLWLGLFINSYGIFSDLHSAVIGAIAGYMVLWFVFWAFKLCTGKEGMGQGDFKFLAALGAWFGWQSLLFIVLFSSVLSLIYVVISGLIKREYNRHKIISFGTYLAGAGWAYLMWGQHIANWYLSGF